MPSCGQRRSEPDPAAAADAIIGDDLERGVVDRDRKLDGELGGELVVRNNQTGAEKNGSDAGIFGGFSPKFIHILVLAARDELKTDNRLVISNEVETGAGAPRNVVREIVLMRAVAADGELGVGLEEKRFVTKRNLAAENRVVRTGAPGEVVTMNSALRRARHHHFVELFLEPAGVARRKFHAADQ